MGASTNREARLQYITEILEDKNFTRFPTSKKIERAVMERGVRISDCVILEVLGKEKLEEYQAKWLENCTDEQFLFELRSFSFRTLNEKLKNLHDGRLKTILFTNAHDIDKLGFSSTTLDKYYRMFPGLKEAVKGDDKKDFKRKPRVDGAHNSRTKLPA